MNQTTPTRELVALLPCPFCGAEPNSGEWPKDAGGGLAIECSSGLDDCSANPSVCEYTASEAVKAWNTRAATLPQGVWLPIDSAPRTGIAVLLFQPWKSGRNCAVIGHYANGWVGSDIEDLQPEPTHWAPLPTPPPAELGKGDS